MQRGAPGAGTARRPAARIHAEPSGRRTRHQSPAVSITTTRVLNVTSPHATGAAGRAGAAGDPPAARTASAADAAWPAGDPPAARAAPAADAAWPAGDPPPRRTDWPAGGGSPADRAASAVDAARRAGRTTPASITGGHGWA